MNPQFSPTDIGIASRERAAPAAVETLLAEQVVECAAKRTEVGLAFRRHRRACRPMIPIVQSIHKTRLSTLVRLLHRVRLSADLATAAPRQERAISPGSVPNEWLSCRPPEARLITRQKDSPQAVLLNKSFCFVWVTHCKVARPRLSAVMTA